MKKKKLTSRQIERAADAIKFLVPPIEGNGSSWTPHGMATVKWPKDFSAYERGIIRRIATAALETIR